ncbi:MAG: 50S ribosomal protein L15 [Treponema sp.]
MSEFDLVMPKGANKGRKILGRGSSSGWGKTAGKGNKGQKARSGGKVYAGFEGGQMPLYRRLAKKGFSNYPFSKEYVVINLSLLESKFSDGETVDNTSLHQKGLLKKLDSMVKILGNGELTKKLSFNVSAVSASAKAKIEKIGGSVNLSRV